MKLLFVYFSFFISTNVFCQLVSGKIIDRNGEPLIGATIYDENNKNNGTISDIDGDFTIKISKLPTFLLVSYVGFISARKEINKQNVAIKHIIEMGNGGNLSKLTYEFKAGRLFSLRANEAVIIPSDFKVSQLNGLSLKPRKDALGPWPLPSGDLGSRKIVNRGHSNFIESGFNLNLSLSNDNYISTGLKYFRNELVEHYFTDNKDAPFLTHKFEATAIGIPIKFIYKKYFGVNFTYYKDISNNENVYYQGQIFNIEGLKLKDHFIVGGEIAFENFNFNIGLLSSQFSTNFLNFESSHGFATFGYTGPVKKIVKDFLELKPEINSSLQYNGENSYYDERDLKYKLGIEYNLPFKLRAIERCNNLLFGSVNTPDGLKSGNIVTSNYENPVSLDIPLTNFSIFYHMNAGRNFSQRIGLRHQRFSRENILTYNLNNGNFFESISRNRVYGFGIYAMLKYKSFGLGLEGFYMYKTKRNEFTNDIEFNKYLKIEKFNSKPLTFAISGVYKDYQLNFFPNQLRKSKIY